MLSVKGLERFHIIWADVLSIALSQVQLYKVRECPWRICWCNKKLSCLQCYKNTTLYKRCQNISVHFTRFWVNRNLLKERSSRPRNCWWCWLCAMTVCSAAPGWFGPPPEKVSPEPVSNFCTGLNLKSNGSPQYLGQLWFGLQQYDMSVLYLCFCWTGCCLRAIYCMSSWSLLSGESGFTRIP